MNRVDFPVSELAALVRRGRTIGDVSLAGQPAATLFRCIAFSAPFGALSKRKVQLAPACLSDQMY